MATPPASSDPDTLIPNLSEDAYHGDAQFAVTIDGVTLGGLPDCHGRARCLRAAGGHRQLGRRSARRSRPGRPGVLAEKAGWPGQAEA